MVKLTIESLHLRLQVCLKSFFKFGGKNKKNNSNNNNISSMVSQAKYKLERLFSMDNEFSWKMVEKKEKKKKENTPLRTF